MHRIFTLRECLQAIIEAIIYNEDRHYYVWYLGGCITAYHAWSEVALDILWSEVDDVRLFRRIGPLKIDQPLVQTQRLVFESSTPPSPAAWDRFYFYSCRVTQITLGNDARPLSLSVYEVVKDYLPRSHSFFPKLRSVILGTGRSQNEHTVLTVPMITPWLGPSLEELQLHYHALGHGGAGGIDRWKTLSEYTSRECPYHRTLALRSSLATGGWDVASAALFLANQSLTTVDLELQVFSRAVLKMLGVIPALKVLKIKTNMSIDLRGYRIPESSFPALCKMHWKTDINILRQLLATGIKIPGLQSLWLTSTQSEAPEISTQSRFCNSLVVAFPSLRDLVIEILDNSGICPLPSLHWFQPLSSLSNLEDFTLKQAHYIQITSESLISLVSGWPNLRHLDLGVRTLKCEVACRYTYEDTGSSLALTTVEELLDRCPHLQDLAICLKGEIPEASTHQTSRLKQLQALVLTHSDDVDPISMANFLSFSGLRQLKVENHWEWHGPGDDSTLDPRDESWQEVSRWLPALNDQKHRHEAEINALESRNKALQDENLTLRQQIGSY